MHQRNTKTLGRSGQSYQSVAREESMHIVKSGQDDVLVPSSENGGSVYQYIKTQMFESLGHISGIVIAENRQTTIFDTDDTDQLGQRTSRGSKRGASAPVNVAGQR